MAQNSTQVCCPNCGGTMQLDPTAGKLRCMFCDSVFTQEEAEAFFGSKEQAEAEKSSGSGWGSDADGMKAYSCSTCGAELLAEENTGTTRCPYCGNSTVIEAAFSGAAKPDLVIPFAFTKEQAIEKYKAYYQKKKLLPRAFLTGSRIRRSRASTSPSGCLTAL